MGDFWSFVAQAHTIAGPCLMLLYPLYASVMAMESSSTLDDEQWLAYWILYSFISLVELIIQPALEWFTIWYPAKLVFVAWLVLPQFKGAAFLYKRFVREQIRKYKLGPNNHGSKGKHKFVDFISHKKDHHESY